MISRAMLARLAEKGVRLINEKPIELEGRKMAFIHPKSANGVLVELIRINKLGVIKGGLHRYILGKGNS